MDLDRDAPSLTRPGNRWPTKPGKVFVRNSPFSDPGEVAPAGSARGAWPLARSRLEDSPSLAGSPLADPARATDLIRAPPPRALRGPCAVPAVWGDATTRRPPPSVATVPSEGARVVPPFSPCPDSPRLPPPRWFNPRQIPGSAPSPASFPPLHPSLLAPPPLYRLRQGGDTSRGRAAARDSSRQVRRGGKKMALLRRCPPACPCTRALRDPQRGYRASPPPARRCTAREAGRRLSDSRALGWPPLLRSDTPFEAAAPEGTSCARPFGQPSGTDALRDGPLR